MPGRLGKCSHKKKVTRPKRLLSCLRYSRVGSFSRTRRPTQNNFHLRIDTFYLTPSPSVSVPSIAICVKISNEAVCSHFAPHRGANRNLAQDACSVGRFLYQASRWRGGSKPVSRIVIQYPRCMEHVKF